MVTAWRFLFAQKKITDINRNRKEKRVCVCGRERRLFAQRSLDLTLKLCGTVDAPRDVRSPRGCRIYSENRTMCASIYGTYIAEAPTPTCRALRLLLYTPRGRLIDNILRLRRVDRVVMDRPSDHIILPTIDAWKTHIDTHNTPYIEGLETDPSGYV